MEIAGYIVSVLMGITLGLMGGGGSILTVPILVYLFKLNPVSATSSSLFIVGVTSLVGAFTYYYQGHIQLKKSFLFAVMSVIGVLISRTLILPMMPENILSIGSFLLTKNILLMILFSVLMLLASIKMIWPKNDVNAHAIKKKNNFLIELSIKGFFIGLVTGLIGAGGGFLIVPALIFLVGLNMKQAVGTSLMIITINSLIGFTGDYLIQKNQNWSLLLTVAGLAILGILIGLKFNNSFSDKALKKAFGVFVLILGIFIFI